MTQLYVSVDASTKASLKKIDRPLFSDFWERFIDSLKALSEKVKCSTNVITTYVCRKNKLYIVAVFKRFAIRFIVLTPSL